MNQEKLNRMQNQVRIGGKGSVRRKRKTVHKKAAGNDQKLEVALRKMGLNQIPGIDEVNLFHEDGSIIHFQQPKAQISMAANTFVVSGNAERKQLQELLPGIINQLGPDALSNLKKLAESFQDKEGLAAAAAGEGADDVPELASDDVPELVEDA